MGRTCGEPNGVKEMTYPNNITALFREQAEEVSKAIGGGRIVDVEKTLLDLGLTKECRAEGRTIPLQVLIACVT